MTPAAKWKIARIALTFLHLMPGWILFTWSLDPGSLLLGAVFSIAIALRTYGLFFDETEAHRRSALPRVHMFAAHTVYLLCRMYASSFVMLALLFTRRINPRVVHFRTRLKSDIARVALSNSITMTPGTVTLGLDDDHLVVHWLDAKTTHSRHAGELISGFFESILKRIWI